MPDWLLALGGQLILAGAIYGGIRADIKNLYHGMREAKETGSEAHKRIDGLLMKGHQ